MTFDSQNSSHFPGKVKLTKFPNFFEEFISLSLLQFWKGWKLKPHWKCNNRNVIISVVLNPPILITLKIPLQSCVIYLSVNFLISVLFSVLVFPLHSHYMRKLYWTRALKGVSNTLSHWTNLKFDKISNADKDIS